MKFRPRSLENGAPSPVHRGQGAGRRLTMPRSRAATPPSSGCTAPTASARLTGCT